MEAADRETDEDFEEEFGEDETDDEDLDEETRKMNTIWWHGASWAAAR